MKKFLDILAFIVASIFLLIIGIIFIYSVVFISEARIALLCLCFPIVVAWAMNRILNL